MPPSLPTRALRLIAAAASGAGVICVLLFTYIAADIRPFEWHTLWSYLGVRGVLLSVTLITGLCILTLLLARFAAGVERPLRRPTRLRLALILAAWGACVLWLAEWTFMERPLTVRVADRLATSDDLAAADRVALKRFTEDGSIQALTHHYPDADHQRLSLMLARIAVNRPSVLLREPIGSVIAENARRYAVDPITLLHWAYLDSFYGEAPSGPMPFFREVNAETFRDLVQAHLPHWFVESPLRIALIEQAWLEEVFGERLGRKLRYAFHKANYDVSTSPYMANTFTDLFLVMKEFRSEFPELDQATATDDPLLASFLALEHEGLLKPYDEPYAHPRRDASYYARAREPLVTFSRAGMYRLANDFEFATKVQAFLVRYHYEYYERALGTELWSQVGARQRSVMLAILRDIYLPNVGHPGYDLYMLPEFSTVPIAFVAQSALADPQALIRPDQTWLPQEKERLWGGTGLMLRALSETWDVMTGTPLPGVPAAATLEDSRKVVSRNLSKLGAP